MLILVSSLSAKVSCFFIVYILQYPIKPTIAGWLFFMYRKYGMSQGARDGGATKSD